MNTITVEYSDGTRATWNVVDDDLDTIGQIEESIVELSGQPDSILC